MSQIASICWAIDFVEAHLKEEITVADMADSAGYSLYHFCRTFNGLVHHTPYDYLMRRRLSESARELIRTDKRIIDIAFDYRFNSPETYSRAFKRMFGLQPSQWKEQGRLVPDVTIDSRTSGAHQQRGLSQAGLGGERRFPGGGSDDAA
jgi:AraC family transcriptional regulator